MVGSLCREVDGIRRRSERRLGVELMQRLPDHGRSGSRQSLRHGPAHREIRPEEVGKAPEFTLGLFPIGNRSRI
jgi:hypothetical protein